MASLADDYIAIQQVLARYCRGVDRRDAVMMRSVYWDEAVDHHRIYDGGPDGFVEWVTNNSLKNVAVAGHVLGQSLIDLSGETAAVETYFRAWSVPRQESTPPKVQVVNGRYLDRMLKRSNEWRIIERWLLVDLVEFLPLESGARSDPTEIDKSFDLFPGKPSRNVEAGT